MNASVGRPVIGQWYARAGKGELFQVVGRDDRSRTIEIQSFDGDVDEIDSDTWGSMLLERSEPPEDWTAPMDCADEDDFGYSETEMRAEDWTAPLQPLKVESESWEESDEEEEPAY